ncbi:hypothetical protein [Bremerella sp.]|uniref:hypothetical protein n=1 Tax=Bremerella sp. TaxID=2795602 RepID=UPI00391B06D4
MRSRSKRWRKLRIDPLENRNVLASASGLDALIESTDAPQDDNQVIEQVALALVLEGESANMPMVVSPKEGDVVLDTPVTLSFSPVPNYNGNYLVRMEVDGWNGQRATGFNHDCNVHYLCVVTSQTSLTVPVQPGQSYRWWVHQPGQMASSASFTTDDFPVPPSPISNDIPAIITPKNGDEVDTEEVVLQFTPLPNYTGNYLVRLQPSDWDGEQASGFNHDCSVHYLCIATPSTEVSVAVDPGLSYTWWVHKQNFSADQATFTTIEGNDDPPMEDLIPTIVSPMEGDEVDGDTVTLEFQPVTDYSGNYIVRLQPTDWDGSQADGFTHESTDYYLDILTTANQIPVPIEPGKSYQWSVHVPDNPLVQANFTSAEADVDLIPTIVSPQEGDEVDGDTVTLEFLAVPDYMGDYLVRLQPTDWDGSQASGFTHESMDYYLDIATTDTQIVVPIEPGMSYRWWVQVPDNPLVEANFTSAELVVVDLIPSIVSPQEGDEVDGDTVTLEFLAVPDYMGDYLVRLQPTDWDGSQASGFTHESMDYYLDIATTDTQIVVPIEPGTSYRWWVQVPDNPLVEANFTSAEDGDDVPPPPSPESRVPVIISPREGDLIESDTVTLKFWPISNYSGNYFVRLDSDDWDGPQASGFNHDCNVHYLCIATTNTEITVPVEPGLTYRWWVHHPDNPADSATFSIGQGDGTPPPPPPADPNIPVIIGPKDNTQIATANVTLEFTALANYNGNYLVRLQPADWNGQQASGFNHDCNVHYLCISTSETSVTVPVEPDQSYHWWVHRPNFSASEADFVTIPVDLNFEVIDNRYLFHDLADYSETGNDTSAIIQEAIDQVPVGATLELPAGKYSIDRQIVINKKITLTTIGKSITDPVSDLDTGDYAELIATRNFSQDNGLIFFHEIEAMHHIVLNGNRQGRQNTSASSQVSSGNNRFGFVSTMASDDATFVANHFINALGGTGMEVNGVRNNVLIQDNIFAYNGVHNRENFWADGLTVHDANNSQFIGNLFIDNTDIDLIFGGGQNSLIENNTVLHSADTVGGAFASIMIHKWRETSGNYSGTIIRGNMVDGGPNKTAGTGLYIASEGWYDETPFGNSTANPVQAEIYNNTVINTVNGMYVAARDFAIYENSFTNSHGVNFPASCGTLIANAPIVVSPTSSNIDFHGEDEDPETMHLFSQQNWDNCKPNWPF